MRLAYYAGASTAAAAACLFKAFHERPNFYSATVYLSQSNACLLILTNLLLVFACSFMYALQRLLYGPLRPIEIEHLSEKAWYAVLDTLLAMPSFRDDVGGWLLAMFVLLLAGKVWGWIGEGKVEVLEQQPPANPRLFHARLATSLITSVIFDMWMLDYCVETVLADPRPGMMVIFTFEFAILSISSTFTLSRYLLSVIQTRIEKQQLQKAVEDRKEEIRAERAAARQNETADGQPTQAAPPNEEPIEVDENEVDAPAWEEKRRYLFFLEVFTDFIKLMIYIVFFTVSITFNGLPMHIMRDVYMTFASFSKRVTAYVAYRKATSDMNTQYPDATTEEISGDACIVCRDTMVAWEQPRAQDQAQPAAQQGQAAPAPRRRRDEGLRAKKLPCGHILHLRCLKSWLERQQVCPTCRRSVVVPTASTQPGAGGVNPAAPGQQGQQGAQAAQRQGRARILNFGPIRIGFLNGPGDQIGNLIRQMQNQQPAAGQDRAQAGNQRGPNHLGLQVPYLGGQQQNGAANAASTQMQIAQIQQRIVQDAQNLGLQQQQLITLQAMEHELERLRMLQQGPQNSIPVAQAAMPQAIPPLPMPSYSDVGPGAIPFQLPMPGQQHSSSQSATALRGNINEELTNGDINLPLGFSIPEGWTLMPLRPANAADAQQSSMQTSATQRPQASPLESTDAAINAANDLNNATSATEQSAVGPTDDNGSPYFEPTVPSTNGMAPPVTEESVARHPQRTTSLSGTQAQAYQRAPWTSGDWSFADASKTSTDPSGGERDPEAAEESVSEPANGSLPEKDASTYSGKGKGKAAEIEDAPDSGT